MKRRSMFIVVALFLLIACITSYFYSYTRQAGSVVLIVGTSSSGKSSIIQELKQNLRSYQTVQIDDFFKAFKDTGAFLDHASYRTLLESFYQKIRSIALAGTSVLVDTIFEDAKEYDRCMQALKDICPIKILIYCSPKTILERVNRRNEICPSEERRVASQAFIQFLALYKPREHQHEQVMDSCESGDLRLSVETALAQLMATIPLQQRSSHAAYAERFYRDFIHHFKISGSSHICVVPRQSYDFIFNSDKLSSEEIARDLRKRL